MSISDVETVVAPTVEAAVAQAVAPSETVVALKPIISGTKCTRDTRGEADCAVKNCEDCN